MINLFDRYHQESKDLHISLKKAGYQYPTIVIEADGFLPDDVISPFTYFLKGEDEPVRASFFNEVQVPPYWEIAGNGQSARVLDMGQERARIRYSEGSHLRLVKEVEWLDASGRLRQVDHYDKYGFIFAKTTYTSDQVAFLTTYLDRSEKERITENHLTGDIILTLPGEPQRIFKNRQDYVYFFIQYLQLDLDHILFNSLALPFLISYYLTAPGQDILVWQEPIGDSIPGNMQLILEQESLRAKRILVPDHATFDRLRQLVLPEYAHKILPIGYIYDFKRDNCQEKQALILTNSDQIEQLDFLASSLSDIRIHVAALTEMSQKLMSMMKYPNLVLHQNVSQDKLTTLIETVDVFLDINYADEVAQIGRRMFEQNALLVAFDQTAHDRRYLAPEHIFPAQSPEDLTQLVQEVLADRSQMDMALERQRKQANSRTKEAFQEQFSALLGGIDG